MAGLLAKGTPWFVVLPPVLAGIVIVMLATDLLPPEWPWIALVSILIALAVAGITFFRDPERRTGKGLVAPVHGRVLGVDEEDAWTRISTFMGPLDVHVVRAPLDGRVVRTVRGGAGYARADLPSAGHNVHLELGFEDGGDPFTVVLISGWFARRIVPYVSVGDRVSRGSRIGLIRFGSRVDVLVPRGAYAIDIEPGSRVKAAESTLGVRAVASD